MVEDAEPVEERFSFLDEIFKGEFTNALLAAKHIYEENNLLSLLKRAS